MTWVRDRSRGGRVVIIVVVAMVITAVGVLASDRGSTSVPALAAGNAPGEQVAANAVGGSTRYVPINPIRVLDTRTDPGRGRLAAGRSMSLAPVTQAVAAATGVAPGACRRSCSTSRWSTSTVPGTRRCGRRVRRCQRCRRPTPTWPGRPWPTWSPCRSASTGSSRSSRRSVPTTSSTCKASTSPPLPPRPAGSCSLTPRRAIDTRLSTSLAPGSSITVDVAAVGVPRGRIGRGAQRHGHADTRQRLPHRVARRHPDAARLERQRSECRLHRRQPGDRPRDERASQRVLVRAHRRHRRRHRLHDRGHGAGRVRRVVRADHPGPPARHTHTGTRQQRAADRLGRHADTADHRARWRTGERGAGGRPERHRDADPGARLRDHVAGEYTDHRHVVVELRRRRAIRPQPRRRSDQRWGGVVLQLRRHRPAGRRDGLLARRDRGRTGHGRGGRVGQHASRHRRSRLPPPHRRPTERTASSTRAHRSRSPPRTDGGTRVRRSGTWPTSTGRPSRWSIR